MFGSTDITNFNRKPLHGHVTKYKPTVNLKVAKAIGIKVPPLILLGATDVIE